MNPDDTSSLSSRLPLPSPPQYPAPDLCVRPYSPPLFTLHTAGLHSLAGLAPKNTLTDPEVQTTLGSPAPPHCILSIISCSPDVCPSLDPGPDLECSVCFSQFNNVFRCPKMLRCRHTFCLECLARINVKSAAPDAVQCPLCRSLTPLPVLGLPKLATDSDVLAYLPTAMQRVYSIRFLRSKGKLQVKRSSCEGQLRLGPRAAGHSLDVGLPSPPARSGAGEDGCLFRLTSQPACRAFLLTTVVLMLVLLTGIIIFIVTFKDDEQLLRCCG